MNETDAKQLADTVRQTAFAVHTFLRHGHNEKVYENSLRNRLRRLGLQVEQQVPLQVHDEDGSLLGDFTADLVVNREMIVELKGGPRSCRRAYRPSSGLPSRLAA
jgi:GxxExxY protein